MNRATRAFLECAGGILLVSCLFAAPALLLGLSARQTALGCLYLGASAALTRALALRTVALWQYAPLCALAAAAALALPLPLLSRAALCIGCALVALMRLYGRVTRREILLDTPGPFGTVLFAAAYLAGAVWDDARVRTLSCLLCALYVLCIMAWRMQTGLGAFLSRYGTIARLPERQIRYASRGVLAACCLLAVLCMALLAVSGAERAVYALGSLLLSGLRFLLSLLPAGQETPAEEAAPEPMEQAGGMMPMEAGEPSAFMQLLQAVLSFLVTAALALGLVCLAAYCVYALCRRFAGRGAQSGDRAEFIAPPTRTERLSRRRGRDADMPLPFTPEGAVRRAFIQTVRRRRRERPEASMTPREIEDFAGLEPGETRGMLHDLYARARYGGGVTREEARALKARLKQKAHP